MDIILNKLATYRLIKLSLTLLFSFLLIGCGSNRFHNFNKQKFTKLSKKHIKHDPVSQKTESEITYEEVNQVENELTDLKEEVVVDDITEFDNENIQDLDVNPKPEIFVTEEHRPVNLEESEWKERRDFNYLSKEEKEQALVTFNWLFNSGLAIFLFAILIASIGYLVLSISNGSIGVVMIVFAGALIFSLWIMSMVALNRVRKIDRFKYSQKFRNKWGLANLVAYIGVAVCVVTILGGVVLLILWATRVISF